MEGPALPSWKKTSETTQHWWSLREFRNNFCTTTFLGLCVNGLTGNPRSSAHWRNLKLGPSTKEDPCHMLIFIYSHRIPWSLFFLMKDDNGSATRFVPCISCCVSASLSSPFCCYFEAVSEKQILPQFVSHCSLGCLPSQQKWKIEALVRDELPKM